MFPTIGEGVRRHLKISLNACISKRLRLFSVHTFSIVYISLLYISICTNVLLGSKRYVEGFKISHITPVLVVEHTSRMGQL